MKLKTIIPNWTQVVLQLAALLLIFQIIVDTSPRVAAQAPLLGTLADAAEVRDLV